MIFYWLLQFFSYYHLNIWYSVSIMEIAKILNSYGKSITKERKDIFSFIEKQHTFMAQDLRNNFPHIGRASIFRTINIFLEISVIRRIPTSQQRWDTYELNEVEHHHEHMKCEKCHELISFESENICQKIFEQAKKKWFKIREHSVSVFGTCNNCSI